MTCTKCDGLIVQDDLREGPDVIPCLRCVMCGKYYFGRATPQELAKYPEPMERKAIGQQIGGVSRERVRQIENKALNKLRIAAQELGLTREDLF